MNIVLCLAFLSSYFRFLSAAGCPQLGDEAIQYLKNIVKSVFFVSTSFDD